MSSELFKGPIITCRSRERAEEALKELAALLTLNGVVTLYDYYNRDRDRSSPENYKTIGWTSFEGVEIHETGPSCFEVFLPDLKPVPYDYTR